MLGPKLQENDPDLAELPQVLTGQDYATLAVPEYLTQYLEWLRMVSLMRKVN
jgi:hypothetical protein